MKGSATDVTGARDDGAAANGSATEAAAATAAAWLVEVGKGSKLVAIVTWRRKSTAKATGKKAAQLRSF